MRDLVWEFLKQGYGVEDIAALTDITADEARAWVKYFRQQGKLAPMYGRARKDRRVQ